MNDNDKSKKERLFCCYYAKLGNIFEAAVRAGFSPDTALVNGMDILKQKKYQKSISVLMSETVSPSKLVKAGLERLAFGSSNDAVYLAFSGEMPSPEKISSLDLFNVSEIKKVKGGGVEVKLFDRQKAMEKMYEFASNDNSSTAASNLLEALTGLEAESEN